MINTFVTETQGYKIHLQFHIHRDLPPVTFNVLNSKYILYQYRTRSYHITNL